MLRSKPVTFPNISDEKYWEEEPAFKGVFKPKAFQEDYETALTELESIIENRIPQIPHNLTALKKLYGILDKLPEWLKD